MTRLSEDDLIARFFAPLATLAGADSLRDDAAIIEPPVGQSFVVTADALVASIHFLADDPPHTIAQKALRVNLSDLAAKGAKPYGFLLSLALPPDWTTEWLADFASGLAEDVKSFCFALLGGDTVKTPGPLTIAVTAFGTVPTGPIPRRAGAKPGDAIYVSGTIGDGALGLLACRDQLPGLDATACTALADRYRVPRPRVGLAPALLAHASASMDVSDGFVGDLAKLLGVSAVGARVELDRVPLSPAARSAIAINAARFEQALTGGDDYEILCTVPPARQTSFEADAATAMVPVARVGHVQSADEGVHFLKDGLPVSFASGSYSHF